MLVVLSRGGKLLLNEQDGKEGAELASLQNQTPLLLSFLLFIPSDLRWREGGSWEDRK